jgi:hypothetical protein
MLGWESDAKVQTRVICLVMAAVQVLLYPDRYRNGVKAEMIDGDVVGAFVSHVLSFLLMILCSGAGVPFLAPCLPDRDAL